MLYAAVWKWKVAPSNSFLQCTITVLITRVSNSLYPSSSHLSTVGCKAFYAEHPLLQPRDNWHPLCLQAERETKVGEREQRKEWEKLESRRERVSCGPIVRSREQSRFLSYLHKQTLSWLKTQRRLKMRFLWPNSRRAPGMSYQPRAEGHRGPGNSSLVINFTIPLNGPGLVQEDGEEENVGKRQGRKRGMKKYWEWRCDYEFACFEQLQKLRWNGNPAWCSLMGCLVQEPKLFGFKTFLKGEPNKATIGHPFMWIYHGKWELLGSGVL